MPSSPDRSAGEAAFRAKHNDVVERLRELRIEVEMFRAFAGVSTLFDRAATLAEVESHLKAALGALREAEETSTSTDPPNRAPGDDGRRAEGDRD